MLSAHLHTHILRKPDGVRQFPILVNSDKHTIQATLGHQEGVFKVFDQRGKEMIGSR